MELIQKFLKFILVLSAIVLIASYFLKNKLPDPQVILSSLNQEPEQTIVTQSQPFTVQKDEFTYHLTPRYNYELYGLVVSYHNSSVWYDSYHEDDPYNTKDLCVLWGENVQSSVYLKMKFSSGDWSCNFQFKGNVDSSWYSEFSSAQGANNHLLPANQQIEDLLEKASRGDQVYIKGRLVDYYVESSKGKTATRATSTVRTDQGNDACEVIYVEDFQILKSSNQLFKDIFHYAQFSFGGSLILLVIFFFLSLIPPPKIEEEM